MRWRNCTVGKDTLPKRDPAGKPPKRLTGVDAARGLALVGLMSVHILPYSDHESMEPTWSYILFYGDSAALFALLAGVGLVLASGGTHPHGGRELAADRLAVVVRAVLIAVLGLGIGSLLSDHLPVDNILIYYGVFFLLAAPFLRSGPRTLFGSAAVFLVTAPVLMQLLSDELPDFVSGNPAFGDLVTQPMATTTQLLLTGTYPALAYLAYLLVGMGVGRLNLGSRSIQVHLLVVGVAMAVCARGASALLLYVAGGYGQLVEASSMDELEVADVLIWSDSLPTDTWWWLAIASPHTNTPLALAASLGTGLAVLSLFLLLSRGVGAVLLPLSAMGSMTLSLYTTHLVALSFEVHYDRSYLWFTIQLVAAVLFAVAWRRALGQGPLERAVGAVAKGARRRSLAMSSGGERS